MLKLQPASQKELTRVAVGTLICTAIMLAVFVALGAAGIVAFNYTVPLAAAVGTAIAIVNFALLCLTVQNVAAMGDDKNARTKMQLSYNGRMMLQTAWCVIAFFLPCFNVFAGALPLLFPRVAIFVLQASGAYRSEAPSAQAAQGPNAEETSQPPEQERGEQ